MVVNSLHETEYEKYKYEKEFIEVVGRHVNDSIKVKSITPDEFSNSDIPFTSELFLGLYLIEDFEGCMSFLDEFFAGD